MLPTIENSEELPSHLVPVVVEKVIGVLSRFASWRSSDRNTWFTVCSAIHFMTRGDDAGYELFLKWSAQSEKFDEDACLKLWESRKLNRDRKVTLGTLIAMAQEDEAAGHAPSRDWQTADRSTTSSTNEAIALPTLSKDEVRKLSQKLQVSKAPVIPRHKLPLPPSSRAAINTKPPKHGGSSQKFATADEAFAHAAKSTKGGKLVAVSPYASGRFQVGRFNNADGTKQHRPVHRIGDGWYVGDPAGLLPLYRSDELPISDAIFVVEGEKCTDAAIKLGLPATTSAHGALSAKRSDWSALAGRTVYILRDHDDAGTKYATDVASILASLSPPAKSKIVTLPGLPEGGDIVDFADARSGLSNEQIKAEVLAAVELAKFFEGGPASSKPVLVNLLDVTLQTVKWMWALVLAAGKFSLFVGNAGTGKTFLLCDVIAHITRGLPLPGDEQERKPSSVILIAPEDGLSDTIKARLLAADADLSRVIAMSTVLAPSKSGGEQERPFELQTGMGALKQAIAEHPDVSLIVIDPITSVLGRADANDAIEVRNTLQPLVDFAESKGIAILATTHLSKASDRAAVHRTLGSGAFTALARTSFLVVQDRTAENRRLFMPLKSNFKKAASRSYCLVPSDVHETPRIVWDEGVVDMDADEALTRSEGQDRSSNKSDEIKESIQTLLEDGEQPRDAVIEAIRRSMPRRVSIRTIDRVAATMGVQSSRQGFPAKAMWKLKPEEGNAAGENQ